MNSGSTALILAACSAIGACGSAVAAPIDTANDAHCSVLAYYHDRTVDGDATSPRGLRRTTEAVHRWYAAKAREIAIERDNAPAVIEELRPVLAGVIDDPDRSKALWAECAERATRDPAFIKLTSAIAK